MSQNSQPNPRLAILRRDVERDMIAPLRSHGWTAEIVQEHDGHSSLVLEAAKGARTARVAILYSSATDNVHYKQLAEHVEHIFFHGQAYQLEAFSSGVKVPVEPIGDFFPYMVNLNKQIEPDRSPLKPIRKMAVRRITEENPLEGILTRLHQFTSINLAGKLVRRRAETDGVELTRDVIDSKAAGIAYSMRSALDYVTFSATDKLNKRILGLYYGSIAFAFSEMLASPTGPKSLDIVEATTKQGHGLYTLSNGSFAGLRTGVLASGFLPQWLAHMGHDTSAFPRQKPKSEGDFQTLAIPSNSWCTLETLFSSMPEIDDLFAEVFNSAPGWVIPVYDLTANHRPSLNRTDRRSESTYAQFIDRSGLIPIERLQTAGWPLAEVQSAEGKEGDGQTFRARVDHSGHPLFWNVLPTHSSPFAHRTTLLLPTLGGMTEYRTIAVTTLYALSIMVRYMPSAWRRIEGGDEDQYLALVKASLAVWERTLPEQFLQSVANETVYSKQPGGLF